MLSSQIASGEIGKIEHWKTSKNAVGTQMRMKKIGKLGKLGGGWLKSGGKNAAIEKKWVGGCFFGQCSFLSIRAVIFFLTPPGFSPFLAFSGPESGLKASQDLPDDQMWDENCCITSIKLWDAEKNGFPPNLLTEIAQNPYFGPFWAGQPDFQPGMPPSLYIRA